MAVISAFHDVSEDCTQVGILKTDELIAGVPLPEDERQDIATIAGALTKKNTITDQTAQLSDRLDRILNASPEATLVRIGDRIDNLLDSTDQNGGFTKRYLASTDQVIDTLSVQALLYGYNSALDILVQIRKTNLKKMEVFTPG